MTFSRQQRIEATGKKNVRAEKSRNSNLKGPNIKLKTQSLKSVLFLIKYGTTMEG